MDSNHISAGWFYPEGLPLGGSFLRGHSVEVSFSYVTRQTRAGFQPLFGCLCRSWCNEFAFRTPDDMPHTPCRECTLLCLSDEAFVGIMMAMSKPRGLTNAEALVRQ